MVYNNKVSEFQEYCIYCKKPLESIFSINQSCITCDKSIVEFNKNFVSRDFKIVRELEKLYPNIYIDTNMSFDKEGRVIELDLSNCNLNEIPEVIFDLTHLKKLYLVNNNLKTLPVKIIKLSNLEVLDLHWNETFFYLPDEIGSLPKLKRLDFRLNKIKDIPKTIGNLRNLIELDLSWNSISYLPKELYHLENLKVLDVSANRIRIIDKEIRKLTKLEEFYCYKNHISEINQELCKIKKLKKLNLSKNLIKNLDGDFSKLKNLEELDLSWNCIDRIPESFTKLKKLKYVKLWKNNISNIPNLTKFPNIESFFMKGNKITNVPDNILSYLINKKSEFDFF
ncbi:MAG: leucine-rich repeat domain-containing protein [Candidatus Hodarchaeales archaeon]|jgi:Leucine-rich repeat (LRR) protein